MEWSKVCEKDVTEVLRTTLNWKAPGREQIVNFCPKQLTATHKHIAALFNKLIEEDQIPKWLTAGVTKKKQKNEKTDNPKNYRQTCDLFAYSISTFYIYYKQTYAKIHGR
jgi:hypothetical protein